MDWRSVLEKIYEKERAAAARSRDKIPYSADGAGVFDDRSADICWWTNGFYAGLLWQLYGYRRCALFRNVAARIERKLDKNLANAAGMDHDSGFKWLLTAGADYALTKSEASKNRLLLAAGDLAGRFNPAGRFLRAWNDEKGENAGVVIIDCMMNLPLLYRASELLHDPRFAQIAVRHAETALQFLVRGDGSCAHIAVFDPSSGAFLGTRGGQGMATGSAWTRGQAWAIYGFALSYLHTKRGEFLAAAERIASFFRTHIPKTRLIPADFMQSDACPREDDSAASIAACGFLELYRLTEKEEYRAAAEQLLLALLEKRCDFSAETDRILTRCTAAFGDEAYNFPLIYADYFFTEAVLKLVGKETFLW